jgi:hypothetical protein
MKACWDLVCNPAGLLAGWLGWQLPSGVAYVQYAMHATSDEYHRQHAGDGGHQGHHRVRVGARFAHDTRRCHGTIVSHCETLRTQRGLRCVWQTSNDQARVVDIRHIDLGVSVAMYSAGKATTGRAVPNQRTGMAELLMPAGAPASCV